jgi:hypothetical protein
MTRGEFSAVKDDSGNPVNAVFQGTVAWRLPDAESGRGANRSVPVQAALAGPPEKMICRRQLRTGTLARYDRTCMTDAEWDRYALNNRTFWDEQQGSKGSTHDAFESQMTPYGPGIPN